MCGYAKKPMGSMTDQESFEVLKAEFEKEREITVNIFVQSQKA